MVQWEYKVGPLTVNFRVLLEPKGFLRIIVLIVALLAFSITAGFSSGSQSNSLGCLGNVNITNSTPTNFTSYITFGYPYSSGNYRINTEPAENISDISRCGGGFRNLPLSSSAQFFVAMGVLTMIYVIGALLVYMLFITPDLFMAKWLVIGDFFLTVIIGLLYLIACIAWSAGAAQLNAYLTDRLEQYGLDCLYCLTSQPLGVSRATSIQSFAQPAISLIFGYLASFIWLSSAWFVYKDTVWHKDKTGPLSSLYNITGSSTSGGGRGGDVEPESKE